MIVRTKIATAVSVALLTVATTATAEVTLYDYTEATSSYTDATLEGTFNATGGNQDQAGYNASLDLDYNRVISSPNRDLEVGLDAGGSISRDSVEGASSSSTYGLTSDVKVSNYFRPNSKGLHWYGSGNFGLQKGADKPLGKIGVGLGYGRVTNVTPMAKAIRLMEALRTQGSLTADPSKATYVRVAKIIALEEEYKSKYRVGSSNYTQPWIADIEKVLVSSGQVNGSLGAGGAIEAHDVLINENIFTRKIGWKVNTGLGLILSNYNGKDGGDPTLDLIEGEYHLPLSNKTQFSNTSSLFVVFGDDDAGYNLTNTMKVTHELTDKVDWENAWALGYSKAGDDAGEDLTTNALSSIFTYELNNQLDLKLTARITDIDDEDDTNNNEEIDTSLNISASYKLK